MRLRSASWVGVSALVVAPLTAGCAGESTAEAACRKDPYASTARIRFAPRPQAPDVLMPPEASPLPAGELVRLVTDTEMQNLVVERLQSSATADQLARRVSATVTKPKKDESFLLRITASGTSPRSAQKVARVEAQVFVDYALSMSTDPISIRIAGPPSYPRAKRDCS